MTGAAVESPTSISTKKKGEKTLPEREKLSPPPAVAPTAAPEAHREDTIPKPIKRKRPMGRIRLVVGDGEVAELHGIVYGFEQELSAEGYRARVLFDYYNRRLKVIDFQATDYAALVNKLGFLADANKFDKIWIYARPKVWEQFLRFGYVLEGTLQYALRGKTAYMVSQFRSQRRLHSRGLIKEMKLIDEVLTRDRKATPKKLPDGYALDFAREPDIEGILGLYRRVFKTYPSPLTYREYLLNVMHRGSVFRVIRNRDGDVVSVASAELLPSHLSAELTDCATHPDERGKGLMSVILHALEKDLRREGYRCAYTMARAPSFGMNAAFHALGYSFNGRMINNCDIYGSFEDMNLWVKDLRARKRKNLKLTPAPSDA